VQEAGRSAKHGVVRVCGLRPVSGLRQGVKACRKRPDWFSWLNSPLWQPAIMTGDFA